jgi:hypothetical protein
MPRVAPAKSQPNAKPVASAKRPTLSQAASPAKTPTKAENIIALLKGKRGATLADMTKATGWQEHSVRGFLAGALKKRHGLEVQSEKHGDGPRRYRLV